MILSAGMPEWMECIPACLAFVELIDGFHMNETAAYKLSGSVKASCI